MKENKVTVPERFAQLINLYVKRHGYKHITGRQEIVDYIYENYVAEGEDENAEKPLKQSLIPSDYCYNLMNKSNIEFSARPHLFEYLGRDQYRWIGANYPYNGQVKSKPKGSKDYVVKGEWFLGRLILY